MSCFMAEAWDLKPVLVPEGTVETVTEIVRPLVQKLWKVFDWKLSWHWCLKCQPKPCLCWTTALWSWRNKASSRDRPQLKGRRGFCFRRLESSGSSYLIQASETLNLGQGFTDPAADINRSLELQVNRLGNLKIIVLRNEFEWEYLF